MGTATNSQLISTAGSVFGMFVWPIRVANTIAGTVNYGLNRWVVGEGGWVENYYLNQEMEEGREIQAIRQEANDRLMAEAQRQEDQQSQWREEQRLWRENFARGQEEEWQRFLRELDAEEVAYRERIAAYAAATAVQGQRETNRKTPLPDLFTAGSGVW